MSIVENIRKLCARDGITINKLERELGLGRGNIARWNTNAPAYDKLMKVAEYFNVTMEELVCSPLTLAMNRAMRSIPGYVDPIDTVTPEPVDDIVKFALFGDVNVDDDIYDEVKRFAAFAKAQREKDKK